MDEEGSIQVIEALLAAMIILTAVLFMTATSAPSPAEGQSGLDLAEVSADTLRVLQQRPPATSITPDADGIQREYPSRLDEIVEEVIVGTQVSANEALVEELVPAGNRFQLRIDNGNSHLILLPTDAGFTTQPRAAKAAETFVVPNWSANSVSGAACDGLAVSENGGPFVPGGAGPFTVTAADTLTAPTGGTLLQGTTAWSSWWEDSLVDDGLATDDVPRAALYGWWVYNDGGGDECFFIGLEDGTTTENPTYGVQLVVWPIA